MRWLGVVVAGAVVAGAWTASEQAWARAATASAPAGAPKATGLGYDVGAALAYIDALARPGTASGEGSGAPRTLGLRDLSLGLAWQAPGGTGLRLVLRPDSGTIAVIDLASQQVVANWSTAPAKAPHGISMITGSHSIAVAGGNGLAVLLDQEDGKVRASAAIPSRS